MLGTEEAHNYAVYEIFGNKIFLDTRNSNFSYNLNDLNFSNINYYLFNPDIEIAQNNPIKICLNISDACNLRCDYCFNPNKSQKKMSIDMALDFIENIINEFPNRDKYYVDLSGKGEPLLNLKTILEINNYCKDLSNKIKREILVSFVSNGTLLTKEIAKILQNNGILFGVSLDGDEHIHNLHRYDQKGNSTFNTIISNIKNIENKDYVGCAVTITKNSFDLLKTELNLLNFFKTISVKPVRLCSASFDEKSLLEWKNEYNKLTKYLLDRAIENDFKLLFALLNGDDYFGKFIRRIILGERVLIRCDSGITRFSLDINGDVFICPASFCYDEFKIGINGKLIKNNLVKIFNEQLENHEGDNCAFRFLCGGECLIERKLNKRNNSFMCSFKQHLILLAIYFSSSVYEKNIHSFNQIYKFCIEVKNRDFLNKDIVKLMKEKPYLTFNEAKKLYDSINKKY